MASTIITYTPRNGSVSRTVTLGTAPVLQVFSGGVVTDREQSFSRGRVATSRVGTSWQDFRVRREAISKTSNSTLFQRLSAWANHAQAGGEFAFIWESGKSTETTTSTAASEGDTSLSVNSTAFSASDWVYIEDNADETINQYAKISTVGAAAINFSVSLDAPFTAGSTVRHLDYYPKCVLVGNDPPLIERRAGEGANLWDLEFRFVTSR